jgi:hypothetical protein
MAPINGSIAFLVIAVSYLTNRAKELLKKTTE